VPEPRASRVIAFAGDGGEQTGAPSGTKVDSGYGPTSTQRDVFLKASLQVPGNANVYALRQSVLLTRRSRNRADVRRGVVARTTIGPVSFPRTVTIALTPAVGETGVTRIRSWLAPVAPKPMTATETRVQPARITFTVPTAGH
jgi:hypothetical protein